MVVDGGERDAFRQGVDHREISLKELLQSKCPSTFTIKETVNRTLENTQCMGLWRRHEAFRDSMTHEAFGDSMIHENKGEYVRYLPSSRSREGAFWSAAP